MAINPAFLQRMESLFPGRDFPAVTDTLHNHGTSSIRPWPRLGAHDRSDQPLQHDVRSVLHGCEPGRLRARADARRGEETARRCGQREAAAADDGAVLRRRADDLADFSRRGPLCGRGGLLQRPGRDQRHPIRAGRRVCPPGSRGRTANRLPAVRWRHRRGERPSEGREPARSEAQGDREPACRGHRRVPGRHDRQHREQRSGRTDREVRARELRQDQLRLLPAGLVHGTGRRHQRRREAREALHALASRGRSETADRRDRTVARLVSAVGVQRHVRRHRSDAGAVRRLGLAEMRLPSRLRHRHGVHGEQEDQSSGLRSRAS